MNPTRRLSPEAAFFFKNAGYSHGPNESPAAGRTRCAESLAAAETLYLAAHQVADVSIDWDNDPDDCADGDSDPITREVAMIIARKPSGYGFDVLASLGGIHDATSDYKRVVRAELAQECAEQLQTIIDKA